MKRNIQPLATPVTSSNRAAATRGAGCSFVPTLFAAKVTKVEESVRSGLLGLCHEIAGLILRRHQEKNDPAAVRREVRARLVQMMSCTEERAERLIDLSLELVHVKIHGHYRRNPLELSILIARAGNQLREIGAN